ncbi:TolC family protein [Clostridium transplantifaecale]|uniref:TolC family protein n=1 Tax=Clostridium transplantifaecale TaxID=2479838 RepID=UPI000F63D7C3|nr:TolC family protein [Clostridium transplantifaecale]
MCAFNYKGFYVETAEKHKQRGASKSKAYELAALSLAMALTLLTPMKVLASSPEFARSEDEWNRLQDDVLEYEEIPDLIQEYNSTVQSNQYEYQKFLKEYGRTREDIAKAYRDMADDLEAGMTGEDGVAMISDFQLRQQADQLREQADDNIEDSRIMYLTYCKAEASLAMSAQSYFISYYRKQLELLTAQEDRNQLAKNLELAKVQRQAGVLTDAEVLAVQEKVMTQEKTVTAVEQQIENTRQKLIVMCGWNSTDQPELTDAPMPDMPELDAIDLDADRQAAIGNNYTVRINRQKLENSLNADQKASIQRTVDGNVRQAGVSLTGAWQSLQSARRSYEQAVSDAAASERDLALAGAKYSAGMITAYDYETARSDFTEKQYAIRSIELDLLEALEVYRWNVNGMASAE